jgi:hypothetical protein
VSTDNEVQEFPVGTNDYVGERITTFQEEMELIQIYLKRIGGCSLEEKRNLTGSVEFFDGLVWKTTCRRSFNGYHLY